MELPKMRWVEALPVSQDGREMFYLRDPEGLTENPLAVSKDVLFLIALMDGKRSLRDLQEEYVRACGTFVQLEQIRSVVEAMDTSLLLDNERYKSRLEQLKREYEAAPFRQPCCSGRSYSEDREKLLAYLDEMFSEVRVPTVAGEIKGILAPHIDYARGYNVYRETYRYLPCTERDLIVIFGTCHGLTPNLWNISLKDFRTPLGIIPCKSELAALVRENRVLNKHRDEWCHRTEHSIELQLPIIQFLLRGRNVEILPILTGSMHQHVTGHPTGKEQSDGKSLQGLIENLTQVLEKYGKPYLLIAGADLAHIGAQFGDRYTLDREVLARSKVKDQEILEGVKQVDARRFLSAIRVEKDARRICGLAPIYFQLSLLEGSTCDLVSYDQWTDGASSVSFAGAIIYK
ncbi:MAG: AmmeMemoRadiSam system protein B [Syntrophales bacterium LBB04]|nr:AmmeMemoRadiSam system protein B [Syntrophales bacterium LBB04]